MKKTEMGIVGYSIESMEKRSCFPDFSRTTLVESNGCKLFVCTIGKFYNYRDEVHVRIEGSEATYESRIFTAKQYHNCYLPNLQSPIGKITYLGGYPGDIGLDKSADKLHRDKIEEAEEISQMERM